MISLCRRSGEVLDIASSILRWKFLCRVCSEVSPLLAGPVAEPPISPRTPPACVSPGFTKPGGLLRFAHRGLISFTPPACKPAARKGCEDINPGLSEAIPGVTATLYATARWKRARRFPLSNRPGQEGRLRALRKDASSDLLAGDGVWLKIEKTFWYWPTTPSAPSRRLRDVFLRSRPPLLARRGNGSSPRGERIS